MVSVSCNGCFYCCPGSFPDRNIELLVSPQSLLQVHMVSHINFVSWNVKGLNHLIKRSKVFSHLKQLRADLAFLEETHVDIDTSSGRLEGTAFSVFYICFFFYRYLQVRQHLHSLWPGLIVLPDLTIVETRAVDHW